MGFLGQVGNAFRTLGSKALGAVQTIGSKVGNVAGKVGDLAVKAAPYFGPGFGDLADRVAKTAYTVGGVAHTAALSAGALRDRLRPGQAPHVTGPGANMLD